MIRAVYDTNIIVSGTLTPNASPPSQILDAAIAGQVRLISSETLIEEYQDVLSRQKFAEQIARTGKTPDELVSDYRALVEIVEPEVIEPVILNDPDDDHVLACAAGGEADYIVSGDKHLLALKQFRKIYICSAHEFLVVLNPPASETDVSVTDM